MTGIEAFPAGTFCWADLAAVDAEEAKGFYAGLFGWSARQMRNGPGVFTMLKLSGRAVASLYQLSEQHLAQGVPAHWMPYVAVVNADETANRVRLLGGQTIVAPFELLNLGRLALFVDSTGAPFAVWQTDSPRGSPPTSRPNLLPWAELITTDQVKAAHFYRQLFGWNIQAHNKALAFCNQGRRIASVRQVAETGEDPWPQWRLYFAVTDCETSVQKAQALGGSILVPPSHHARMGRFAVVQDSQGAVFAIVKPTHFV